MTQQFCNRREKLKSLYLNWISCNMSNSCEAYKKANLTTLCRSSLAIGNQPSSSGPIEIDKSQKQTKWEQRERTWGFHPLPVHKWERLKPYQSLWHQQVTSWCGGRGKSLLWHYSTLIFLLFTWLTKAKWEDPLRASLHGRARIGPPSKLTTGRACKKFWNVHVA